MNMTKKILLFFFACAVAQGNICRADNVTYKVFDVTSYGAAADGKSDSAQAILKAWADACAADCGALENAKVMIPAGNFLAGPVDLQGPCKGAMVIEVNGVLIAPTDLGSFKKEWIVFRHVNGLLITGAGKIDGQGGAVWHKMKGNRLPPSVKLLSVSNANVQSISFINSKFFHLQIGQSVSVAVTGITISSPADSPNTDGIHVAYSTDVKISNSTIGSGDDCISIGPGSTNVTVTNVNCGPGHGISVGSLGKDKGELGVDGVYVTNCTLNGTTNGVRIKTWQDSPAINAVNMVFSDIVVNEAGNPIIIDQEYCPGNCDNDKPPSNVKISNVTFENIRGTSASDVAISLDCSAAVPCEIILKDINLQPLPPSPGLLPAVPLSTCEHISTSSITEGDIFPPSCF
ncbi:Exopolygalacturonase [Platanthera zijinensis]|uniref:Exopolygalacturonase n=1 Tax=Platanthera zijinensis TaxID=2320716 RepID=A0AAP0AUT0_9ASPA